MAEDYEIFWGDTHHNTYQHYVQDPSLAEVLEFASTHLDFYTGAYYTPAYVVAGVLDGVGGAVEQRDGHLSEALPEAVRRWKGVHLEDWKDFDAIEREWAEFQSVTARLNQPGDFVALPGYEWQGDGRWGDHNVVYKTEGLPVFTVNTLPELYDCLRGKDALAIPHHTGYYTGQRAPKWEACDDSVSPFAELFSIHGCSETDEEWIGLRRNAHMGPGVGGSTYQEALDYGLHLGAVCSTDNWTNMPGHWGQGLMACLARDLSREALWEAFLARRVYGVTGDRIRLDFSLNGAPMGGTVEFSPKRAISVAVRGSDAIDRVTILRNGRAIATHCHQGTWELPQAGQRSRYKLRIEAGWGPRPGEVPMPDQKWSGALTIDGGRVIGWEPCWISRGPTVPEIRGDTVRFGLVSRQIHVTREFQGGVIFEIEAAPESQLVLRLNDIQVIDTVAFFAARSRLLWYRDECVDLIRKTTGTEPEQARRGDCYYQLACKAKLHRAIPEAGYTAHFGITDEEPLEGETNYRVRVEQRNGQRAWSSPIWVKESSG